MKTIILTIRDLDNSNIPLQDRLTDAVIAIETAYGLKVVDMGWAAPEIERTINRD